MFKKMEKGSEVARYLIEGGIGKELSDRSYE